MTSTAATAVIGLALLTILATSASCVVAKKTKGREIAPSDACGGDYDGTKGNITSPNYPGNYPAGTCIWTVTTPPNTRITVTIEDFHLYNSNDYLEIRDGNDSTAELIEKCTRSSCDDITTSTNTLYLKFYSSNSENANGFKLIWFSDSCGGEYEGTKGVITSPSYPRDYPYNSNCTWRITSSPNTRITVTLEAFSTYDSYDYLEIRDGNDSTAQLIEKCSESSCADVTSTTNILHLYFNSNNAGTAKGFKLIWFSDPDYVEHYTGTKGVVDSVNHPNNYPNDVDCVWTITTLPNTKITINFESFDTYNSSDFLQIRDGPDMNAKLLERCSGSSCSGSTSSSNSLYIHFHSNSEDQASGFKLNWYSDLFEDKYCYFCGNSLDSNYHDPSCGEDNYNGHDDKSPKWNACFTTVYYSGDHVERGGIENIEEDGACYISESSTTCYCTDDYCNSNLCKNCSSTPPPLTSTTPLHTNPTSLPIASTPTSPPTSPSTATSSPATSTTPSATTTTNQSSTPAGPLSCFSCISCDTVSEDTQTETSEDFLSCFTAIELGGSHFVIRGGSPDLHVDGSCRQVADGAYECYCNTNRCNSDAMEKILGGIGEVMNT